MPPPSGSGKGTSEPKGVASRAVSEKSGGGIQGGDRQQARDECVVVGIGASAGGLESFERLMGVLPPDSGVAYVLVQHFDPSHESLMASLLSRHTEMPVQQVEDAVPIRPNRVYIIPPNKYLKIRDGGLFLEEPVERRGIRMPIDYFFTSLAEARQERSICIVLSGNGSDGTLGLKEIKGRGGLALVQKPETAEYDGMPRSAMASGMVDMVTTIEDIPKIVANYVHHPYVFSDNSDSDPLEKAPDHFNAIMSLLRSHTGYDFHGYKKGTLKRRIHRRMSLRQIKHLDEYLKLLRTEAGELQWLFKDLLIGVTRFFRDPQAWQDLASVLREVVRKKQSGDAIRAWVAGCSSGEEAYSLAILLFEELEKQNKRLEVQIFATDIDVDGVAQARSGVYPKSIAGDVSPERLNKFFREEDGRYRITKRLRETCVFAVQNLIGDPPFSNLDLITCRNVVIYLESEIQSRLASILHFALAKDGLLLMGTSESVSRHANLFQPVSQTSRIY